MSETDNVVPIRRDESRLGSRGGDGDGGDGTGTGGKAGERLAALEVHAQVIREEIRDHVATKHDLSNIRAWIAGTGLVVISTIIIVLTRMIGS